MTACTIPLPTLMSFFLKDMPFTLPPEHVMVDPPAVVKVLPSDMSARVTAPWMTWCLTMSGSAWCDMRSILVVPSFWASSTKASSLGQKTVISVKKVEGVQSDPFAQTLYGHVALVCVLVLKPCYCGYD